jgi:hypothetical protein
LSKYFKQDEMKDYFFEDATQMENDQIMIEDANTQS